MSTRYWFLFSFLFLSTHPFTQAAKYFFFFRNTIYRYWVAGTIECGSNVWLKTPASICIRNPTMLRCVVWTLACSHLSSSVIFFLDGAYVNFFSINYLQLIHWLKKVQQALPFLSLVTCSIPGHCCCDAVASNLACSLLNAALLSLWHFSAVNPTLIAAF